VPTFLLIHGAWHGAWCWDRLAPHLLRRGHRVVAIDLPAHGDDPTPWYRTTLRGYAECVSRTAAQQDEPPLLVGHSMGGMVITQAAHQAPQQFAGLVYLCAFVPLPGDRMLGLARSDGGSVVGRHSSMRLSGIRFPADAAGETFCGECDADTVRWAGSRLRPEPILPMLQRLKAGAPLTLPRVYLECTRDRAISLAHQRAMAGRAGMDRVLTLDSDHSPFLSMPEQLAERLHAVAGRL
jgi:pimeloyl-ACP methyl ester carboxylesterase